jgi:hypothetical protein
MKNKKFLAIAALLATLLVPPVLANVYVPTGPPLRAGAWTIQGLSVWDVSAAGKVPTPIGWTYSENPMYNPITQVNTPKIEMSSPLVPSGNALDIPWGTKVMVLGFIPKVSVSADQVPPPVELQITWNGIPNLITLTLPANQTVGIQYPPVFYPDKNVPYEFAWPAAPPSKNASYNIWVGDYSYILQKLFNTNVPPIWFETMYGKMNGYWFWYTFTPNAGDWIAWDCIGQTKFPPTYDITALFEYGTSQIWFNHIAFDVSLIEFHKTVTINSGATAVTLPNVALTDNIIIKNVGKLAVTKLNLTQTFPSDPKHGVFPETDSAMAMISGPLRNIGWTPLAGFAAAVNPSIYTFPAPFNFLNPGETMTITMEMSAYRDPVEKWNGTVVFDSMVWANEIPPWKAPIGLHSVVFGTPTASLTPLWNGYKLVFDGNTWSFGTVPLWFVQGPLLRRELLHPSPVMTLDPLPEDLNGDGVINAAEVNEVRSAVIGLIPYDMRMDCNGNGKVDIDDLMQYKAAAGV